MKNQMKLKWIELAKKCKWKQCYMSMVLHGYLKPSKKMIEKARPALRKSPTFWDDASISEVQAMLEKARIRLAKVTK
jgi:hypothetical protein